MGIRNLIFMTIFLLCLYSVSAHVLTNATSCWSFNNTLEDTQGLNNGTINGTENYIPGVIGQSFYCDGSSYITIADNDNWSIGTNDFAIGGWVYFNASSPPDNYFYFKTDVSTNEWVTASLTSIDDTYGFCFDYTIDLAPTSRLVCAGTSLGFITNFTWHFVAVSRENGQFHFYLDGIQANITTDISSNPIPDSETIFHIINIPVILCGSQATQNNILYDETFFFNGKGLSETELNEIYYTNESCIACVPTWIPDVNPCQPDNFQLISYTDSKNCHSDLELPIDNGTLSACDYCSSDIVQNPSSCIGNQQAINFTDNNFFSCCASTNLTSDCGILFAPYNGTTMIPCFTGNLTQDLGNLTCQVQPNMGVNDKEYCVARIPLQYSNETFKCIGVVYNGETGEIMQTTPQYRETSQTFFNLFPESETRQYFIPANNLVNFYYTSKNLHPDNVYVLSIECSSSQRTLTSRMLFQTAYERMDWTFYRLEWLKANASYIILGLIVLIIVIVLLYFAWKAMFP